MFCSKCDTKALDGAEFCPKCGTRLTVDNAEQKQAKAVDQQVYTQSNNAPSNTLKKKKSKKLSIIICIVVFIVVALFAINADYFIERSKQDIKDQAYIKSKQAEIDSLSETYTNKEE